MTGQQRCIAFPGVTVTCSISKTSVVVNERLVFSAAHEPAWATVQYSISHGDGTLDPRQVSHAYYAAPGTYEVAVIWQAYGHTQTQNCGFVTVSAADCKIGRGAADEFVWVCDGTICSRTNPAPFCPPYPIYGCHPTVEGPVLCIDPAPIQVSCAISPSGTVEVGQVLTFTSQVLNIADAPIDLVFEHGDGTLDPRPTAYAYYESPGSYTVRLRWNWAGGSGVETCGTVTVTAATSS